MGGDPNRTHSTASSHEPRTLEGLDQGGQVLHLDPLVREQREDFLRPWCRCGFGVVWWTGAFGLRDAGLSGRRRVVNEADTHACFSPPSTHIHKHHTQTKTTRPLLTLSHLAPAGEGKHERADLGGQTLPADLLAQGADPGVRGGQVSVPYKRGKID